MKVTLAPELEELLREKVESGEYRSPDEVINAAMRLLKESDEGAERLEKILQEAEDSGEATEMTAGDWADIRREGLKLLKSRTSA